MTRRAWAGALLLTACGPDAAEYDYLRTERVEAAEGEGEGEGEGEAPIPDEPLEDWDVEGADPLSGIFAVETVVKAKLIIDLEARLVHRLRLVRRGRHVRQRFTLCDVELPSMTGVAELTIPPLLRALIQSIPADSEGDFLSSEAPVGALYAPDIPDVALGPEDADGDGQPGVTVTASAVLCEDDVEVYAALRIAAGVTGEVVDADTIAGEADPTLEQEILGWSDECISPAAALEVETMPGSTFVARRVSPDQDLDGNGNVSCAEIVRTRETP